MSSIEAVLFDLDGTLVDTAPDLIHALNLLLVENSYPEVAIARVMPYVSGGSYAIIQAGLGEASNDALIKQLQPRYLELYKTNISRHSTLFEGMKEVLDTLEKRGLPWGVVTNKPHFLTEILMKEMALDKRCCAVVSGDTTEHAKPHPEPLYEACKRCGILAENCLYIGDDLRDVQAGNSAGMVTLSAAWGYYRPEDKIEQWPAQALLQKPEEILHWL